MRELNLIEIQAISGSRIRPSEWTWSAAAGALIGCACFVLTASTANPVSPGAALAVGSGIGAGLHAAYDVLHEYGL